MQVEDVHNFCVSNIRSLRILNNRKVLRAGSKRSESLSCSCISGDAMNRTKAPFGELVNRYSQANPPNNCLIGNNSLLKNRKHLKSLFINPNSENASVSEPSMKVQKAPGKQENKLKMDIEELKEVIRIKSEHLDLLSSQMKGMESCASDVDEFNFNEKKESSNELAELKRELVKKEFEYSDCLSQDNAMYDSLSSHKKSQSTSCYNFIDLPDTKIKSESYSKNGVQCHDYKDHTRDNEYAVKTLQKENHRMKEKLKKHTEADKAYINSVIRKVQDLCNYMAANVNQEKIEVAPRNAKEQWELVDTFTKVAKSYIKTMETSLCDSRGKGENTVKVVFYGDSNLRKSISKLRESESSVREVVVGVEKEFKEKKEELIDLIAEDILTEAKQRCTLKEE
eukprot:TRINITY_DN4057_c0_g1_i11.p1 TRINITY_DN4057_c0_g1~~TRINITY_DN4057_c0_g1_i11.p1  ORF type:complete len:396 (-),score=30.13 TRINITY_DN4057_c0_g1_i11:167-1354(-)